MQALTPHPPSLRSACSGTLSHRKSGLPDLRNIVRNPGKPGFRGRGSTEIAATVTA